MKKVKYTPEIRDRAVQLLIESEKDYPSTWAAITAIAPKIGCTPETLRVWYQKYLDKQNEPYRVCRRVNILRDYSDEKTKLYPRN